MNLKSGSGCTSDLRKMFPAHFKNITNVMNIVHMILLMILQRTLMIKMLPTHFENIVNTVHKALLLPYRENFLHNCTGDVYDQNLSGKRRKHREHCPHDSATNFDDRNVF